MNTEWKPWREKNGVWISSIIVRAGRGWRYKEEEKKNWHSKGGSRKPQKQVCTCEKAIEIMDSVIKSWLVLGQTEEVKRPCHFLLSVNTCLSVYHCVLFFRCGYLCSFREKKCHGSALKNGLMFLVIYKFITFTKSVNKIKPDCNRWRMHSCSDPAIHLSLRNKRNRLSASNVASSTQIGTSQRGCLQIWPTALNVLTSLMHPLFSPSVC